MMADWSVVTYRVSVSKLTTSRRHVSVVSGQQDTVRPTAAQCEPRGPIIMTDDMDSGPMTTDIRVGCS